MSELSWTAYMEAYQCKQKLSLGRLVISPIYSTVFWKNRRTILGYKYFIDGIEVIMKIAPWPDFDGNPIRIGDSIIHPDGSHGVVVFLTEHDHPSDQWRVDYGDGVVSRLCLQVGDKGQAIVSHAATSF